MNQRITRRQIVEEQDRYGGYQTAPLSFADRPAQQRDLYADFRLSRAERGLYDPAIDGETARAPQEIPFEPVRYSGRVSPIRKEFIGIDVLPAAEKAKKQTKKASPDEIMPSIRKTSAVNREKEQETKAEAPVREKPARITGSLKTTLVIYLAAVIVLSIVVIATGIALTASDTKMSLLEDELIQKTQVLNAQQAEIGKFTDPVYIGGAALNQDMEKIKTYNEIPLIEFVEPEAYAVETNWFDRFCSFISGLFGG